MIGTSDQWRPFYPEVLVPSWRIWWFSVTLKRVSKTYDKKKFRRLIVPGTFEAEDFFANGVVGTWLIFVAEPSTTPPANLLAR